MSMELLTFQTSPGCKQGRKSPLNVLVGLFNQHAMVIFFKLKINAKMLHLSLALLYSKKFEKSIVA